ncbi:Phospholipid scramblase 2 [Halotydeus destructor]|nr:Phospholipid scramblase 2 [Halotydeus destructor]
MSVHPADQYANNQFGGSQYSNWGGQAQPAAANGPGDQFNWMPHSGTMAGVTPGLEHLTQVDHLLVEQQIELVEVLIGYETANKYMIKNSLGQSMYYAVETDNSCCARQCLGSYRPFTIKVLDNYKKEVITMVRPFKGDCCWAPCWMQELDIMVAGQVIGHVVQEWSLFYPKFQIQDLYKGVVLRVHGPFSTTACCGDVEFKVLSRDGQVQVGKISKQWSGFVQEAYTDADNFGISFPLDLDHNVKATLLGACFLIDFMYYEGKQQRGQAGSLATTGAILNYA